MSGLIHDVAKLINIVISPIVGRLCNVMNLYEERVPTDTSGQACCRLQVAGSHVLDRMRR